jgi:UDP-glucose 4-epimerase
MNDRSGVATNYYITWVVGRGLIGRPIEAQAIEFFSGPQIDWQSSDLEYTFAQAARDFQRFVGTKPWAIVWSAGRGVVGTNESELDNETKALTALLGAIAEVRPEGQGVLVGISSAGAIYAGSADAPFDEQSTPCPVSAYGEAKLEQENLITASARDMGVGSFIVRAANVYGVGQDMYKAQGLISHLCRTAVTRQSTNLFVSADTIRHYVHNQDLAALVHGGVARVLQAKGPTHVLKIAATRQSVTVGEVVGLVQRVSKVPMRVGLGSDSRARAQARDLRLRSSVWTDLDQCLETPLVVGVKEVLDSFRFPAAHAA